MISSQMNVSRETLDKLRQFEDLIIKWNPTINLISKSSVSAIWDRHIVDSAQLFDIAPPNGHWVDLGSGGGFPGIVAAVMAQGVQHDTHFTLIESDQRKCVFLRTAARELDLNVEVLSERIESAPPQSADVLTARALADLAGLLSLAARHLADGGVCFFPKGEKWREEHRIAQATWSYGCEAIKSITNPSAAILKIKDIKRV